MAETVVENTLSLSVLRKMRKRKFAPPADTSPSFSGKTVLITGANAGIGLEAAIKFAHLGAAKVVIGVRTAEKGRLAKQEIEQRSGVPDVVDAWMLDLQDYASIVAFADRVEKELAYVHIATMNAGVFNRFHQNSRYGVEEDVQVNVVSTMVLSLLLMPKLIASRSETFTPVLEIVSSWVSTAVRNLSDAAIQGEGGILKFYSRSENFDAVQQYAVSKALLELCHVKLASVVHDRQRDVPLVLIPSVCPGSTKSGIVRNLPLHLRAAEWLFQELFQLETEEGARTYIHGTTLGYEAHGMLFSNMELFRPGITLMEHGSEKINEPFVDRVWKEVLDAVAEADTALGVRLETILKGVGPGPYASQQNI